MSSAPAPPVTLVTGFPMLLARTVARRLLETSGEEQLLLLVRQKFLDDAQRFVETLPELHRARLSLVEGDVVDLDLGLSGADYRQLRNRVTTIHHLAQVSFGGARRRLAEQVNVEGTRGVLDFARQCPQLRRFVHWSTALVSGRRAGPILEQELDCGQRFSNLFEETRFRAERLVAEARHQLPITVLRPGIIVGDTRQGEVDRLDGPYVFMMLLLTAPREVSLPLPGRGEAPLNLVPMDWVAAAGVALGREPRAVGGTYHLTDPSPLSARAVYELVAQTAGRRLPRGVIPTRWASGLFGTPLLAPLLSIPLDFVGSFHQSATYSSARARALLEGAGSPELPCPPFSSYVGALVDYLRSVAQDRRQRALRETAERESEGAWADPLDESAESTLASWERDRLE